MKEVLIYIAVAGILLLSGSATVLAQQAPVSKPSTVRSLQLIITDNKGNSLGDVQPADLELKENGVPVTVDSLEMIEKPVHYGLLIDVSGSLRSQFPLVLDAARRVISSNTQEDQTFILRFIDKFEMVQNSTSNKAALFSAIDQLKPDRGQTALFDSLYLAAKWLQEINDPTRRKALVVITDGENRSSSVREKELFDLLRETDLNIFIIGVAEELDRSGGLIRASVYERSVEFLQKLAKETGGRLFFAKKNIEPTLVDQIAHDLRRQYVLKYLSPNAMPGSGHKVEIKVIGTKDEKKLKAIYRPSYTAQQLLNDN